VAGALGGVRRLGIGGWTIDLTRRRTILAGRDGVIEAVWDKVNIRGHAAQVLQAVRALGAG
jgi:peroxiredoxin